jgi:hypothetical protein
MTSVAPRDEKLVSGISGGSLGCVRVNLWLNTRHFSWHGTLHLGRSKHERTAY